MLHDQRHSRHGAAGVGQAVLRQVAGICAALACDVAVVQALNTGEHFQESRLAGAVRAHQSLAVTRRNQPVETLKENLWAETLTGLRELEHKERHLALAIGH